MRNDRPIDRFHLKSSKRTHTVPNHSSPLHADQNQPQTGVPYPISIPCVRRHVKLAPRRHEELPPLRQGGEMTLTKNEVSILGHVNQGRNQMLQADDVTAMLRLRRLGWGQRRISGQHQPGEAAGGNSAGLGGTGAAVWCIVVLFEQTFLSDGIGGRSFLHFQYSLVDET